MAITEQAEAANLALLISDLNNAPPGPAPHQAAVDALTNFAENTAFADLGLCATAAAASANAKTQQAAINGMAEALSQVSSLQKAFSTATQVAADGENNLLFPRIAATLGQVDMILTTLKQQFDAVKGQVDALKAGVDVNKLQSLATSVQTAATTLQKTLSGL